MIPEARSGWAIEAHPKRGEGLFFILGPVKCGLYPGPKLYTPVHGWDEPFPLGLITYVGNHDLSPYDRGGPAIVHSVGPNVSKPPHFYIASYTSSSARWRAQGKIRRQWPALLADYPNLELAIMEALL